MTNEVCVRVAIPSRDGLLHVECVQGLLSAWSVGVVGFFDHVRGGVAPHNRDIATANFHLSDTESTHLLCVDSDTAWMAQDIIKLLELDVDFAFGKYRGKALDAPLMCRNFLGGEAPNGYMREEWELAGAGFMLLSRRVIQEMYLAYGKNLAYRDSAGRDLVALWQTAGRVEVEHEFDGEKRVCGRCMALEAWAANTKCIPSVETDDYAFCRRWRALGGRIYTRADVALGHVGLFTYRA